MTKPDSKNALMEAGRQTLTLEGEALHIAADTLRPAFADICRGVLEAATKGGRTVLMGVGKSGHIAAKIAATLSSTGTPAQFIHPTEAAHGDLGAVALNDLVLMLSKSGASSELEFLIPALRRRGNPLACFTCEDNSPLGNACDICLLIPVMQEACPNNLAPTTSTTLMMAMGDALATAILKARGFSSDDFALSHPGGRLGRQLLLRASDLMRSGDALPLVAPEQPISEALLTVSRKGLGLAIIASGTQAQGVLTDGDLRRGLQGDLNLQATEVNAIMTRDFRHIPPSMLAVDALNLMQQHSITALPVLSDGRLEGVLTLHDIIRAGVV